MPLRQPLDAHDHAVRWSASTSAGTDAGTNAGAAHRETDQTIGNIAKSKPHTYAQSGVDVAQTDRFIDTIKTIANSTKIEGVLSSIGGFSAVLDPQSWGMKDPLLLLTTDGVGTKLKLTSKPSDWYGIGIDVVAMCVNDLLVSGARPLAFLDYLACHRFEEEVTTALLRGIADGCRQSGCVLAGGETAVMPRVYAAGDLDVAGFAIGIVERKDYINGLERVQAGDVVIGLSSSGLHSNGFSLVHAILDDLPNRNDILARHDWVNIGSHRIQGAQAGRAKDFENDRSSQQPLTLREALLQPTTIYASALGVLRSDRSNNSGLLTKFRSDIHAIANITGGGLEGNIHRVLPSTLRATISLPVIDDMMARCPVIGWVKQAGNVSDHEMRAVFNHGVGMVLIVARSVAHELLSYTSTLQAFKDQAIEARSIGIVEHRLTGEPAITFARDVKML